MRLISVSYLGEDDWASEWCECGGGGRLGIEGSVVKSVNDSLCSCEK